MSTLKEVLWKTLEDMKDEEFKKFKWLLKEAGNNLQAFPAARLEKADRQDTVDLMVQKYGDVEALKKFLQVLEKIDRNDLVQRLSNTSSVQRGEFEKALNAVHSECKSEKQRTRLREMMVETRLKIQQRQMTMCEIQRLAELSRKSAEQQIGESLLTFTFFIETVQKTLDKLLEAIEEKQKTAQNQAEAAIRELEQEISELTRREAELEHLLLTEDYPKLVQDFKTFNITELTFSQPSYGDSVMTTVDKLKEILNNQMNKFLSRAKLIRMQQFVVDVTLDPDTAHPNLVLSKDGKQVYCSDTKQNLPDNPKRFNTVANVLTRQSFSSGRLYFEVQVRGKSAWDVGVVYRSIERKGSIRSSPDGGHWAICLRGGDTFKAAGLNLDVKAPVNKVGVFVDYEGGSIMFYNVDFAELIHRYSDCAFTDSLYPFFSPGGNHGGLNSTPLVISKQPLCYGQIPEIDDCMPSRI